LDVGCDVLLFYKINDFVFTKTSAKENWRLNKLLLDGEKLINGVNTIKIFFASFFDSEHSWREEQIVNGLRRNFLSKNGPEKFSFIYNPFFYNTTAKIPMFLCNSLVVGEFSMQVNLPQEFNAHFQSNFKVTATKNP
jgi:hypothetical protein